MYHHFELHTMRYTSFREIACVFGYRVDIRKSNLFSESRSILPNVNMVVLVFDHAIIVADGHNRQKILCVLRRSWKLD
jgi:hypothetical protein